jgi:hypothetical protein
VFPQIKHEERGLKGVERDRGEKGKEREKKNVKER